MCFYASCSGAVLAGQEAGAQMEHSSFNHPEHLEEVEGEIWKEYMFFFAKDCIKEVDAASRANARVPSSAKLYLCSTFQCEVEVTGTKQSQQPTIKVTQIH